MEVEKEDIILDEKYHYKFDNAENRYKLHYLNKPFPPKPKKIFKFYSLSLYSLASLYDGYFWQANPKSFNDPFDCNLNLAEYEDNFTHNLEWNIRRNDISNIGISCFTEEIENPLMWGHYTSQYNGFVLEFHSNLFQGEIDEDRIYSFNPVIYLEKLKKIKANESYALEYLTTVKDARWKYEKEWRLVTTINKSNDRTVYFNKEGVKAIYIGHKIPDEEPNQYWFLLNIFEDIYPKREIYVVYPNPIDLSLIFERINEEKK